MQRFDLSMDRTDSAPCGAKGFTLVEMLVVIGIVGVLAALISAATLRARESARATACVNNLKSLGGALAACLTDGNGYFPDAYYDATGSNGQYVMALKALPGGQPDVLFKYAHAGTLVCRNDRAPVSVLARTETGDAAMLPTSYAYNVSLPLLFRNSSRVAEPVSTVTFYEGSAQSLVGPWQYSDGWANQTASYRHSKEAKFLYLDGHVDSAASVPSVAFSGGQKWVASSRSAAASYAAAAQPSQQSAVYIAVRDSDGKLLTGIPVQSCTSQNSNLWQSAGVTDGNGQASTVLDSGDYAFSVQIFGSWFVSSWYTVPQAQNLTATVNVSFSIP